MEGVEGEEVNERDAVQVDGRRSQSWEERERRISMS